MKYLMFGNFVSDIISDAVKDVLDNMFVIITNAMRSLFYFLADNVYSIVIYLYNLFEALCHGRLLGEDTLHILSQRIGIVLGLIMLFYVVISFIQMLINPDNISNETKGATAVIKRVLIVIVMFGVSSFVFETLFQIQNVVVDSHVISRLLLPTKLSDNSTQEFGNVLASELFVDFYNISDRIDEANIENDDAADSVAICKYELYTLKDRIYESGEFDLGTNCLNTRVEFKDDDSSESQEMYIMNFQIILMMGVGIYIIYILVSYCITIGVRMFQIAVLEIISPMAFVSYLSPKQDNMFSKWIKMYFGTYIDVFLRIGIINMMVFLIATVLDYQNITGEFWSSITIAEGDRFTAGIIKAVMIVSLLTFAKKAPELLKDLFPTGASKLGLGGFKFKDILGGGLLAGAAAGAAVGVATGAAGRQGIGRLTGALGGGFTGMFRGGAAGSGGKSLGGAIKSAGSRQWKAMKDANSDYNRGATFLGRMGNKVSNALTAGQTNVVQLKNQKDALQRQLSAQQRVVTERKQQLAQRRTANVQNRKVQVDAFNRQNQSFQKVSSSRDAIKDLALKRLHAGKLDQLDANSSGAKSVINLESKIAALEEKRKNINPNDTNAINNINEQILSHQEALKNAQDAFVSNYYSGAVNAELETHKAAINSELSNHADWYGDQNASDWKSLDALGNFSNQQVSDNSTALNRIQVAFENENLELEDYERRLEEYERSTVSVTQNQISDIDQQIAQAEIHGGVWGPTMNGGDFPPPGTGPFPPPPPPGGGPGGGH